MATIKENKPYEVEAPHQTNLFTSRLRSRVEGEEEGGWRSPKATVPMRRSCGDCVANRDAMADRIASLEELVERLSEKVAKLEIQIRDGKINGELEKLRAEQVITVNQQTEYFRTLKSTALLSLVVQAAGGGSKDYPAYSEFIKVNHTPDHDPEFQGKITYCGVTMAGTASSKDNLKQHLCYNILSYFLRSKRLNELESQLFNHICEHTKNPHLKKKLLQCGDVESNPGPSQNINLTPGLIAVAGSDTTQTDWFELSDTLIGNKINLDGWVTVMLDSAVSSTVYSIWEIAFKFNCDSQFNGGIDGPSMEVRLTTNKSYQPVLYPYSFVLDKLTTKYGKMSYSIKGYSPDGSGPASGRWQFNTHTVATTVPEVNQVSISGPFPLWVTMYDPESTTEPRSSDSKKANKLAHALNGNSYNSSITLTSVVDGEPLFDEATFDLEDQNFPSLKNMTGNFSFTVQNQNNPSANTDGLKIHLVLYVNCDPDYSGGELLSANLVELTYNLISQPFNYTMDRSVCQLMTNKCRLTAEVSHRDGLIDIPRKDHLFNFNVHMDFKPFNSEAARLDAKRLYVSDFKPEPVDDVDGIAFGKNSTASFTVESSTSQIKVREMMRERADRLEEMEHELASVAVRYTQSQFMTHIAARAKFKGYIGEYFYLTAKWGGINIDKNNLDTEMEPVWLSNCLEPNAAYSIRQARKDRKEEKSALKKRAAENKLREAAGQPQNEEPIHVGMTVEEKAAQYTEVIDRLVAKFRSGDGKGMLAFSTFMQKPSTVQFKRVVCDALFGDDWEEKGTEDNKMSKFEFYAYCYFNNINNKQLIFNLLSNDLDFPKYCQEDWFISHYGSSAADQAMHNKMVHMLNGNPTFQNQSEIDALPAAMACVGVSGNLARFNPIELRSTVLFQNSTLSPRMSDSKYLDRVLANCVSRAGAYTANCAQQFPVTNLHPRNQRPVAGGVLVDSNNHLPTINVGTCQIFGNQIALNEQGQDLALKAKQMNTSQSRPGNQIISGFAVKDLNGLLSDLDIVGLSMETVYAKLVCILDVLSHGKAAEYIPRNMYTVADPFTKPLDNNPALGYGNALFGEHCGWNNNVLNGPRFPYQGGTGSISFHVTPATVPLDEVENAFWVSPAMLNSTERAAEALMISIATVAPWPWCLAAVIKRTSDALNANPEDQTFVIGSSLISIPGMRTIHVILPRTDAGRTPPTNGEAGAVAYVMPTAGPLAILPVMPGNLTPNQVLTVNGIAGPLVTYPLTQYLMSWFEQLDTTSILNYLANLSHYVGVNDGMYTAYETVTALSYYTRPLIAAANAQNAVLSSPDWNRYVRCNANLMRVSAGDWPLQAQPNVDYRMGSFSVAAYNKVITGLAVPLDQRPSGFGVVPQILRQVDGLVDKTLLFLSIAVATDVFSHMMSIATNGWEGAMANTEYNALNNHIPLMYSTTGGAGMLLPAKLPEMIHCIFKFLFQRQLSLTRFSSPIIGDGGEYCILQQFMPPVGYTCPQNDAGTVRYTGCNPIILSDTWSKILTLRVPKSIAAFPPPNSAGAASGYVVNLEANLLPGNLSTTFEDMNQPKFYYPNDQLPDVTDEALYNRRLVVANAAGTIVDTAGNAIVGAYTPANTNAFELVTPLDDGQNLTPNVLAASTLLPADVNNTGQRQFFAGNRNLIRPFLGACHRSSTMPAAAWLTGGVSMRSAMDTSTSKPSRLQVLMNGLTKSNFGSDASSSTLPPGSEPAQAPAPSVLNQVPDAASSTNFVPLSNTTLVQE